MDNTTLGTVAQVFATLVVALGFAPASRARFGRRIRFLGIAIALSLTGCVLGTMMFHIELANAITISVAGIAIVIALLFAWAEADVLQERKEHPKSKD
jgi:O-antigen/teichoic acid export membrane protein